MAYLGEDQTEKQTSVTIAEAEATIDQVLNHKAETPASLTIWISAISAQYGLDLKPLELNYRFTLPFHDPERVRTFLLATVEGLYFPPVPIRLYVRIGHLVATRGVAVLGEPEQVQTVAKIELHRVIIVMCKKAGDLHSFYQPEVTR